MWIFWFKYKDKDYDLTKEWVNVTNCSKFNMYIVLDQLFFTEKFLDNSLFSNRFNLINSVFIFDYTEWKDLVHKFKKFNIELSGGSTTKRQVLSPVQINLARFLISVDGLKKSHNTVVNSFNLHEKIHKKVSINIFSKDYKLWLIREYIKFIFINNENSSINLPDFEGIILLLFLNNIHSRNKLKILFETIDNKENFIKQLNNIINDSIINYTLDLNFADYEYVDNFNKKLTKVDLINYPLKNRMDSIDKLNQEIELYKNMSRLKKSKKILNTYN